MFKIEIELFKISRSDILLFIPSMSFKKMFKFLENVLSLVLSKNISNILVVK